VAVLSESETRDLWIHYRSLFVRSGAGVLSLSLPASRQYEENGAWELLLSFLA
jgi:hypothetical protein